MLKKLFLDLHTLQKKISLKARVCLILACLCLAPTFVVFYFKTGSPMYAKMNAIANRGIVLMLFLSMAACIIDWPFEKNIPEDETGLTAEDKARFRTLK